MTSLNPEDGPVWQAVRITSSWATVRRILEATQQLKVAEGRLLWLLRDGRSRTLRTIAEELGLEQSTVNRQVHAALDSGVVTRSRQADVPTYLVRVSDQGWHRLHSDLARQLAAHERALSVVPESERDAFLDHLDAYVDALRQAVDSPAPHTTPAERG